MEKLIINDLSLKRKNKECIKILKDQVMQIINIASTNKKARSMIRCSRATASQVVINDSSFLQIAASFPRDDRYRIISWLSNIGPFWDDGRTEVDLDYFTFETINVTDQGLGELGRMYSAGLASAAFSFQGSDSNLYANTLKVAHGIEEIVIGNYDIRNCSDAEALLALIEEATYSDLYSWIDMLETAKESCEFLNINEDAISRLISTPFAICAANKILSLLKILNEIIKNTDTTGTRNEIARRLVTAHFAGDNADFSDESERNKIDFRGELTFRNISGDRVFAPWHGKVNTPKIRVHFDWPWRGGIKKLDVYYIGPKLTKR